MMKNKTSYFITEREYYTHHRIQRRVARILRHTKGNCISSGCASHVSLLIPTKENKMLKKCFTGFSLLVFVFTAAVPLLFPTNQVIADANYQYSQPYTAYYYCPDGTLLYTTTGTTTNSVSIDHPPVQYRSTTLLIPKKLLRCVDMTGPTDTRAPRYGCAKMLQ